MTAFSFACTVAGWDGTAVVNECSAGAAKTRLLSRMRDCGVRFVDIRVRKLGPARSSEAFLRLAAARGRPQLRCGDIVEAHGRAGIVLDHTESANLVIRYIDPAAGRSGLAIIHPGDLSGCRAPIRQGVAS